MSGSGNVGGTPEPRASLPKRILTMGIRGQQPTGLMAGWRAIVGNVDRMVSDFFGRLSANAGPNATPTIRAAQAAVMVAVSVASDVLRGAIEAGRYREWVEEIRERGKALVRHASPRFLRWVPCVRLSRVVDYACDWLLESEAAIAAEVGARVPVVE